MAAARRYRLLPDHFSKRLCGRAVLDPENGASSGFYAPGAADYDSAALAAAGVAREQVGDIQPAGSPIGRVLPGPAREWGLNPETLVVTGTNDQYTGALGAGNCRPRTFCSVAAGTCLALVVLARKKPRPARGTLLVSRFQAGEFWAGLTYAKTAGLVVQWFQEHFCPGLTLRELDRAGESVPAGSRGLIALPHFDGTVTPVTRAATRGFFYGVGLRHTRADFYRAIIESLCFVFRENIEFMARNGFPAGVVRAIGGGARSDLWLQTMANGRAAGR